MTPPGDGLADQEEFWMLLVLLAALLLNWPLLTMTGPDKMLMGFPLRLIYLGIIWLSIILATYLFDRRTGR
ncbi:MAG: hypothetical protein A4E45_00953 [Methanosaeta sp. PtaB.Bin039]|nr:MAG: hypothetical protein A4E45_00953 [Methanosaeta sp. PtaB.Bin039]OPY45055.1 MAG: hypothetical protein A4E47_01176 [Methanosaeta sp. PtaU1.Bin028]HOT06656.1 hypothetical protein [Methanotrichaceae archaeon]HQF16684.1 hypothetical protein [Methanotrichaceae archaeon]HQI91304.1 hypothetical protein [Methanotrichaceae archaeon]